MSPIQGWFESDEDYRSRVAREADERTIENSTGSAPLQGWFESDDSYCERIAQEANERTIEDLTGSAPLQGWFESDDDYDTRIRKEANEQIVEGGTGSSSKQGWFEGDHDYRSRIAHEAREVRARERSNSSTGGNPGSSSAYYTDSSYSSSSSTTGPGSPSTGTSESSGGFLWVVLLGGLIVGAYLLYFKSPDKPEVAQRETRKVEETQQAEKIRKTDATHGPSFDCVKATYTSERLICSFPDLASLDLSLANAYRDAAARSDSSEKASLRNQQNYWLRHIREKCQNAECLRGVYEARIDELKAIKSEKLSPPPTATHGPSFDCVKATYTSERLICSFPDLASLDLSLANVYRDTAARSDSSGKASLRNQQNYWLRHIREKCQNAECLQGVYEARIDELKAMWR